MKSKQLHITFTIIKIHFKLLRNWLLFGDKKIIIISSVVLFFLFIPPFSIYFGEQTSLNSQIVSIIFTLFFPISIAGKYLIFTLKEDSMLSVLFNKKDLFVSKQLLISFFSLSIFCLMLLFGVIPHLRNIPISILISIEIVVLLIFSWLLPYISLKLNFKTNTSKSTGYWDFRLPNINLLPVRGIVLREFLNLWRENKKTILKIFINAILINILLILFIVNNGKEDLIIWALTMQNFIFLFFVINYSALNNINMMKSVSGKEFYILKGEFVFWLTLFLVYITFITAIYSYLLSQIALLPIVITILLFSMFLLYVLLVRLAYAENGFIRILIFYMMLIPITIPFYIYKSYRRLK